MHLTQACWGKGAGGEGGAATLSWNSKPGTLSAGACVVHSVFVHTLGPALQEYLSPEPGVLLTPAWRELCGVMFASPQISALRDTALWYRACEAQFHGTIAVDIINWGIKYGYLTHFCWLISFLWYLFSKPNICHTHKWERWVWVWAELPTYHPCTLYSSDPPQEFGDFTASSANSALLLCHLAAKQHFNKLAEILSVCREAKPREACEERKAGVVSSGILSQLNI